MKPVYLISQDGTKFDQVLITGPAPEEGKYTFIFEGGGTLYTAEIWRFSTDTDVLRHRFALRRISAMDRNLVAMLTAVNVQLQQLEDLAAYINHVRQDVGENLLP